MKIFWILFVSVIISLCSISSRPVFAVTSEEKTVTTTVVETTSTYTLPYPGMLPNHPLYFLKDMRDQLLEWIISDPIKKIEFFILQADKRLAMAMAFAKTSAYGPSNQSLEKEDLYFQRAVQAIELQKENVSVSTHGKDKVRLSLKKHMEEITLMIDQAPTEEKERLSQRFSALQQILEKVTVTQ